MLVRKSFSEGIQTLLSKGQDSAGLQTATLNPERATAVPTVMGDANRRNILSFEDI